MPEQQFDTLPSEAQELPLGAQHIFQAAFKSASEDGMSEDAATRVAWNSVKSLKGKAVRGITRATILTKPTNQYSLVAISHPSSVISCPLK